MNTLSSGATFMNKQFILILGAIVLCIVILLATTVYYLRCQPVIHVTSGCPNLPTNGYTDTPTGKCLQECDKESDECYKQCGKNDECIRHCYESKAGCYMKCLGTESFTPTTGASVGCASCKGPGQA